MKELRLFFARRGALDMKKISFTQFTDIEMQVGKIIRVEDFPHARKPAYKLWIDFGKYGVKKSSAQITKLYDKQQLLDFLVVAVMNFHPKQVADFMSEVLVLGVIRGNEEVSLLTVDQEVELGSRIS